MLKTNHERARFQHDVFLEVLVNCRDWLQLGVMTVRAALGHRHADGLVDVLGLGALPGRVPHRSSTLLGSGRGTLRLWGRRIFAPFELAAVQGMKLSLESLVLQFERLGVSSLRTQLPLQFLQLIFVVAFGARDLLVASEDPASGQPLQIGAPIPIRAGEVRRQVLKFGHGQSGGGNWSSCQFASESRCRSLRTLR
jgi:hypothetical protein